jgi:tRNA threonylcarbamoyl adenosine modification protein YeaZ
MGNFGLALHTSSPALGLAIGCEPGNRRVSSWDLGRETSNYLHPYLREFLAPQTWQDLGWIAVAKGPGGFTGTRLGVVTARTLAQQLDLPLFTISSLAAIAWTTADTGTISISIPAQRGEIYGAVYHRAGQSLRTILPDRILSPAVWQSKLTQLPGDRDAVCSRTLSPSENLADTVSGVLDLAQAAYDAGERPHWSMGLPFYGQDPVDS